MSPEALAKALTPRTKAVILCTPSNPTGAAYAEAELRALVDVLRKHDCWLIVDEIYAELVYDGFKHVSVAQLAPDLRAIASIIVDGVSKTYAMTGWRIGWSIAPERLAKALDIVQGQSTTNATAIAQHAAVAALTGPQDEVERMRAAFEKRRDVMVEGLNSIPGVRCRMPEGAFYAFADCRGALRHRHCKGKPIATDEDVAFFLLDEAHVAAVPGGAFGAPGYVRFSYATSEERIEAGLESMRRAIASARRGVNEGQKRFEQAASAVAALLVAFAGFALWRSGKAPSAPHAREVRVAWRCADGDGPCKVVSDLERCTTCHDPSAHPKRAVLVDKHADIGCVACHGGDGYALEKKSAHEAKGDEQARCAACHAETTAALASPAKTAWARFTSAPEPSKAHDTTDYAPDLTQGRALFRSLRCGACHVTRDSSPPATPLDVLAARSTPAQLAAALEKHAPNDLGLDASARAAVVQHLASIESSDASTSLPHRASVPGSSADEGKILFDKLACAACHETLHVDLSSLAERRTPDWVAWYVADPARANPSTRMPSLRLSAREAASLAQHLVRPKPFEATPSTRHDGEALVTNGKCGACHAVKLAPNLALDATKPLADHAGFHFDEATKRALAVYLRSQRVPHVRPDLRVAPREGEAAFVSLGCAGCHATDAPDEKRAGPSLFGEGLRVQPQWLFDFLRAPQRHAVRPPFHPEWAYRELVPAEHATPRMPTFALDEETTTALVRFFVDRDGATYPYAASSQPRLAGDALASAIADVTHKDRGACLGCHTIAPPDVTRARESEGKLAPPLALAHDRLRPAWIEACILQPSVWVAGMPALERPRDEIVRVRDLVLLLRDRTVLPPAGAEGQIPALGLGDLY